MKPRLTWLLVPVSFGAFLATWGGWAKLASMTGYRDVEMIPGVGWTFNIGIVLPITVEPFGTFAMAVAFNPKVKPWARWIAGLMAVAALVSSGICQAVVHHLTVDGKTDAPPAIVTIASILPVIVLGMAAALGVLYSVRAETVGTSQGRPGMSPWGRIRNALGDAAASQAERLARASQTSRDADPVLVPGTTQGVRVGTIGSETIDVPAPETLVPSDVPTGQELADRPRGWDDMSRDDRARVVLRLREERPRPSFDKIAERLGISKSEAGRLGQHAQDNLLKLDGDPVILELNDYRHPAMKEAVK